MTVADVCRVLGGAPCERCVPVCDLEADSD
jgi:hypothetical protein